MACRKCKSKGLGETKPLHITTPSEKTITVYVKATVDITYLSTFYRLYAGQIVVVPFSVAATLGQLMKISLSDTPLKQEEFYLDYPSLSGRI